MQLDPAQTGEPQAPRSVREIVTAAVADESPSTVQTSAFLRNAARACAEDRDLWRGEASESQELAASAALERLLKFRESLQSTAGKTRQFRDFSKAHEGTRAARDARIMAAISDGEWQEFWFETKERLS